MKNAKKLLVFGKNDSRHLSNYLQTHIFFLSLRHKCFSSMIFSRKTCTLMPLSSSQKLLLSTQNKSPWIKHDKGMCLLKILDNVLLSWVSIECEPDSPYVSKIKPVNKIHAQSSKWNASKSKSLKLKNKTLERRQRCTGV